MMRKQVRVVHERHVRPLEPARTLDEDQVVSVDHHFADRVVAEKLLERPVPEHVIRDLPLDAPPLLAGQRRPVEGELLGDRVQHALREVLGALALEELRAELGDHGVMDRALQLGVRVARAGRNHRRIRRGGGGNGASERNRTLCDYVRGPVLVLL